MRPAKKDTYCTLGPAKHDEFYDGVRDRALNDLMVKQAALREDVLTGAFKG